MMISMNTLGIIFYKTGLFYVPALGLFTLWKGLLYSAYKKNADHASSRYNGLMCLTCITFLGIWFGLFHFAYYDPKYVGLGEVFEFAMAFATASSFAISILVMCGYLVSHMHDKLAYIISKKL